MIKLAAVSILLVLFFVSACGTMTQELTQEDAATAEATVKIKAKLVESDDVDAASVRVELKDEVVVLSGFVASEEEASEVVRIAEQEAGEYPVKNELVVK
ncbi:BON domain-containing protein [bacterium]|nr:BON domain-containing protein [bacterium]